MLRELAADPGADEVLLDHLHSGESLPMDRLLPILKVRLGKCATGRPVLLDGFPRRLDQAVEFEEVVC